MGWFNKKKKYMADMEKERQQDKRIKMIADELPKLYSLILGIVEELAKREKESVESAVVLRPDEKLIVIAPEGMGADRIHSLTKDLSDLFEPGGKGFVLTHDFKVFVTKKNVEIKKKKIKQKKQEEMI